MVFNATENNKHKGQDRCCFVCGCARTYVHGLTAVAFNRWVGTKIWAAGNIPFGRICCWLVHI